MQFVAIDFETANMSRDSACALGVAVVDGDQIVDRQAWLIRPPELLFHPMNVTIHGITEDDVRDKPTFGELWPSIVSRLEGRTVVAHYASFDISVLRHVLDRYYLPYPDCTYFCTCLLSRYAWPKLISYGLASVAEHLGIAFTHHDACEDAVACAVVAVRACQDKGTMSLDELARNAGITQGHLFPGGYRRCGRQSKRTKSKRTGSE